MRRPAQDTFARFDGRAAAAEDVPIAREVGDLKLPSMTYHDIQLPVISTSCG